MFKATDKKQIGCNECYSAVFITNFKHIQLEVSITDLRKRVRKAFLWKHSTPKIKHETLCNDYKAEGLKKCRTKLLPVKNFDENF